MNLAAAAAADAQDASPLPPPPTRRARWSDENGIEEVGYDTVEGPIRRRRRSVGGADLCLDYLTELAAAKKSCLLSLGLLLCLAGVFATLALEAQRQEPLADDEDVSSAAPAAADASPKTLPDFDSSADDFVVKNLFKSARKVLLLIRKREERLQKTSLTTATTTMATAATAARKSTLENVTSVVVVDESKNFTSENVTAAAALNEDYP
jgi:hypothetical protein